MTWVTIASKTSPLKGLNTMALYLTGYTTNPWPGWISPAPILSIVVTAMTKPYLEHYNYKIKYEYNCWNHYRCKCCHLNELNNNNIISLNVGLKVGNRVLNTRFPLCLPCRVRDTVKLIFSLSLNYIITYIFNIKLGNTQGNVTLVEFYTHFPVHVPSTSV